MTERKADMIELHVHLDGSLRPETIWGGDEYGMEKARRLIWKGW